MMAMVKETMDVIKAIGLVTLGNGVAWGTVVAFRMHVEVYATGLVIPENTMTWCPSSNSHNYSGPAPMVLGAV